MKAEFTRLFQVFFFFTDTATTEIYTLSLHDALPILRIAAQREQLRSLAHDAAGLRDTWSRLDRKSTRLNSSHVEISYAVFCLKKKKTMKSPHPEHGTIATVDRQIPRTLVYYPTLS